MFQSILFKEWLKIRVVFLLAIVTVFLFAIDLYYGLYRGLELSATKDFWYTILYNRVAWYNHLKFIPVLVAFGLSIAQYYPEVVDKRLKLTLHLPVNENKVLFQMMGIGFILLMLVLLMLFALFLLISLHFLPLNLVMAGVVTILPWLLAGMITYFLTAFIVMEPVWKIRIAYAITGIHIIAMYLLDAAMGAYQPLIKLLALFSVIGSLSVYFPVYRLRKGKN